MANDYNILAGMSNITEMNSIAQFPTVKSYFGMVFRDGTEQMSYDTTCMKSLNGKLAH